MALRTFIFLCLLAAPSVAAAQTINLQLIEIERTDGENLEGNDATTFGLNSVDCENPAGTTLTIAVTPMPTVQTPYLWRGTDCQTEDNRNGTTITCVDVGQGEIETEGTNQVFKVRLSDLLASNAGAGADACNDNVDNNITLFAFFTSSAPSGDISANFGSLELPVDNRPPVAPEASNGSTLSGETNVNADWNSVGGEQRIIEYRVYGREGDCGSSFGDLPSTPLARSDGTSANVPLSSFNVGDMVQLVVTAVDGARNEGPPSEPICVAIVSTEGFCEVYEGMGGQCGPNGGCSAAAGGSSAGALIFLSLLALRLRRKE